MILDENYDSIVQRCFDSTRFFALLLTSDNGQKAMVGIGFPERNDSFDFVAGLNDFRKQLRIANGTTQPASASVKEKDFSLKEGETISINIPGISKKPVGASSSSQGVGLKKLAPPPGSKKPLAPPTSTTVKPKDPVADIACLGDPFEG